MRENVYLHFKFTPKTTRQVLLWGLAVPGLIAYTAYTQDVSRGCGDGET
jgi:hypothetical protein